MRVVKMSDIIYVLELHMETPEAAGVVLDLLDYMFEIEGDTDGRENNWTTMWKISHHYR